MHNNANDTALALDPVLTWLETVRDSDGEFAYDREMAKRALDRLRPPAVDDWSVIGQLVDDLGTLRANDGGALISDRPNHPSASADDAGYYGGYLVGESITRRNAIAFSFLPQLLVAAREHPFGRRILHQLAQALTDPVPQRTKVTDRLDACLRLARLQGEFFYGSNFEDKDPFCIVSKMLERIAQGVLDGSIEAAADDVAAWLDRKREARFGARRGGGAA